MEGKKNKKNIAVLSTMYYPVMGAPSACVDKYVQRLAKDYSFHIITRDDNLDSINVPDNVHYFTSKLHELRKYCEKNKKSKRRCFLSRLMLGAINVVKLIQTQFLFPTAQYWEVEGYFKELERLYLQKGLDVVIPVSNNFVTQLAMLKFKRKYPEVKWIAFITDPYTENYIYYKFKLLKKFWRKSNFRKEQEIYSEIDYGLFTSEMYKYVPKAFEVDKSRFFKIEFSLTDYNLNNTYESNGNSICKLIYAGLFYKTIRNPEFALSILSKVKDIQFDMFVGKGECEDIIAQYSQDNFSRSEFVEREKYLNMINSEYDILVNIGNNATLQSPSKMVELLSTGKPIINFYHSMDDQYDMIERYPLGINIGESDDDAVRRLTVFCREMKGKSIPFAEVNKLYPENDLTRQVELMRKLIEG